MRNQLEQRLHELKGEFVAGQKLLAELEARQMDLKSSLLRISGAIQVLEELLSEEQEVEKLEQVEMQAVSTR